MKKGYQWLLLEGTIIGLNITSLIIEFVLFPESRYCFTFSYYLNYLTSSLILSTLYSLTQVFVINWERWWKIWILPTILIVFQILLVVSPDPMGDGLEAAYTSMTLWANGLNVILSYFELWSHTKLFCTVLLWVYLTSITIAVRYIINKQHIGRSDSQAHI